MITKVSVLGILLSLSQFATAGNGIERLSTSCQGEAQIIATVAHSKNTELGCLAFIKQISYYNESGVCPLNITEIALKGIYVAAPGVTACEFSDQEISGVVVLDDNGQLYLE